MKENSYPLKQKATGFGIMQFLRSKDIGAIQEAKGAFLIQTLNTFKGHEKYILGGWISGILTSIIGSIIFELLKSIVGK